MTNHLAILQRQNVKDLIHELGLNMKLFAEQAGISYGTCTNNFGKGEKFTAPSPKTIHLIETNMNLGEGFLSQTPEQRNGVDNNSTTAVSKIEMVKVSLQSDDGAINLQMSVTKEVARKMLDACWSDE